MSSMVKIGLLILALAGSTGDPGITDEEALTAGRALTAGLGSRLKAALTESGPVSAIEVCSLEAMPLTAEVSAKQGLTITRITDRPRNPINRATDEEAALLTRMREDLASGKLEKAYSLGEVRYLPLTIQPVCLTCHGQVLHPDVTAALEKRYPDDEATGYALDALRGAVRLERP